MSKPTRWPNRKITLEGADVAATFATQLIQASKWFAVTPLPDDEWEFEVKDEPGIPVVSQPRHSPQPG